MELDMSIIYPIISLGGMGILFGLGLGFAGVKFKVPQDERVPLVRDALPGANCGGCGFAGCDALATAIVEGNASITACPVGGASTVEKIGEIMGLTAETGERQAAFVKCNGGLCNSSYQYDYKGLEDCRLMAQLAGGGSKSCTYGCLGGGTCAKACPFDAIKMIDGIAKVDQEKCTACGMCVATCPKSLIELVPCSSDVRVACNSRDNGKVVRSNCQVGCIGCKLCEKACPIEAVKVEGFLAKIDYEKCTGCNACALKCPTGVIKVKGESLKKEAAKSA